MTEQNLTPEQKLDAIYDMLQKQESRQKRTTIFRTLKWFLILGIVYFLTANPAFLQGVFTAFVGTTMDAVKPMILEQVKTVIPNDASLTNTGDVLQKLIEMSQQSAH